MTSEDWCCPVCFEDRASVAGTVNPSCKHEICLPCYSEIRDRDENPVCVLCRALYRRRSQPILAAAPEYDYDIQYAEYRNPYYPPLTEDQAAAFLMDQLEPFAELNPRRLLTPAANPTLRDRRAAARKSRQPAFSTLNYKQIVKLLTAPAVEVGTTRVLLPAEISHSSTRERQARILGLQKATQAEKAAKGKREDLRTATAGATSSEGRKTAIRTFSGAKTPLRGFRLGDVHISPTGAIGKCVGHHLWHYDDNTVVRKGVSLGIRQLITTH